MIYVTHLSVPDRNRSGSILFPRFELPHERRETRGHGSREGVVLVLEALPDG